VHCVAGSQSRRVASATIAQTLEHFGRLDYACNNGIIHPPQPIAQLDTTTFDCAISIDLRGVFLCLKHDSA
jgi:NAD(P)-dependent dehydrogenase (short-subunit alcohol dehydrogenase family)